MQCEECGVSGCEISSNQTFDAICEECHRAAYFDCACGAKTLYDYDEETHCHEREHCECESCSDIRPLLDCIGCGDMVDKPRDCDTAMILDVCRYCLFTMCLVCLKTTTESSVCRECVERSVTYHVLSKLIPRDVIGCVMEYVIPRRCTIVLPQDQWRTVSKDPLLKY